jgi:hypothetical protein
MKRTIFFKKPIHIYKTQPSVVVPATVRGDPPHGVLAMAIGSDADASIIHGSVA